MGKSKRKKDPGNNSAHPRPVASQPHQQQQRWQVPKAAPRAATTGSAPGRGEIGSPASRQVMGKVHHRATGNSANDHHLPTITRGPPALRQMHHHGSSPLQRTPASQAVCAKIEFLSQIATWAASNKIPSLGALYGERLASVCQTAGIPSPVLKSQCERCESVLLPGVNYSVRTRSKKRKGTRNTGEAMATVKQSNTVVHRCNYCKYGNQTVRSLKDDRKTKQAEAAARAEMKDLATRSCSRLSATATPSTPVLAEGLLRTSAEGSVSIPVTPTGSEKIALSPASVLQLGVSASSSNKKRKRKGWTGLRGIASSLQRVT